MLKDGGWKPLPTVLFKISLNLFVIIIVISGNFNTTSVTNHQHLHHQPHLEVSVSGIVFIGTDINRL